jgi:hypothetical protein
MKYCRRESGMYSYKIPERETIMNVEKLDENMRKFIECFYTIEKDGKLVRKEESINKQNIRILSEQINKILYTLLDTHPVYGNEDELEYFSDEDWVEGVELETGQITE